MPFPLTDVMRLKHNFFLSRQVIPKLMAMDVSRFKCIAATALPIIFNQRRRRCVVQALMARKDPYTW